MNQAKLSRDFLLVSCGWAAGWIGAGLLAKRAIDKILEIDKKASDERLKNFSQLVQTWSPYVPEDVQRNTLDFYKFNDIVDREF